MNNIKFTLNPPLFFQLSMPCMHLHFRLHFALGLPLTSGFVGFSVVGHLGAWMYIRNKGLRKHWRIGSFEAGIPMLQLSSILWMYSFWSHWQHCMKILTDNYCINFDRYVMSAHFTGIIFVYLFIDWLWLKDSVLFVLIRNTFLGILSVENWFLIGNSWAQSNSKSISQMCIS